MFTESGWPFLFLLHIFSFAKRLKSGPHRVNRKRYIIDHLMQYDIEYVCLGKKNSSSCWSTCCVWTNKIIIAGNQESCKGKYSYPEVKKDLARGARLFTAPKTIRYISLYRYICYNNCKLRYVICFIKQYLLIPTSNSNYIGTCYQ